jgi:hypothetical protein
MKSILLISFFLNSVCSHFYMEDCKDKYLIEVWDYDYSMAYTTFYKIDTDSVTVEYIGGVKNEKNSTLMKRHLGKEECKMVCNFFSSHNIDQLKNKYSNPLVDDGDQKRVILKIKGKAKTIEIANFYQKDMGELFDVINKIVNKDLQIKYKRPS